MSEEAHRNKVDNKSSLEEGTYEIIKGRLQKGADELTSKLTQLNALRKDVFGSIETELVANERITTANKCVPRDIISFGSDFIFGYNVHIGLRTTTQVSDVFSVTRYDEHSFQKSTSTILSDKRFVKDFENLYQYYRETQFSKFVEIGPFVYMIFQIGKRIEDNKVFKWQKEENSLRYIDNRSTHEIVYPDQHEFVWKKTNREMYRKGEHPHVSIEDKVFVETIGGDLTIKIENNTDSGKGIFAESVEYKEQGLDDADISYAIVENLIFLKIIPYKEKEARFIIYNDKIKQATRVDGIEQCCALLPDDHGVIFPQGIYLQSGEVRLFNLDLEKMMFEKRIASPNGEDFLYIFYDKPDGIYLLLSYNLIEQTIGKPIICHGYSLFENGELCFFKSENEVQAHHSIQIWTTPFLDDGSLIANSSDSFLTKVGNKEVVRAMSECKEVIKLIEKEDSYDNLYVDLVRKTTDVLDTYYWLDKEEGFELEAPLLNIKKSSTNAIEEFEKVVKIKLSSSQALEEVELGYQALIKGIKNSSNDNIDKFVGLLVQLRTIRGNVISLKDKRYINFDRIEEINSNLEKLGNILSENCVEFLLKREALLPYSQKVQNIKIEVDNLKKVIDANTAEGNIEKISSELEMLIDIVSNLKIEDPTQTTKIIDGISEIYAQFNLINANLKKKRKELQSYEGKAEFNAQIKLISQGIINYLDLCDEPDKCEEYLSKLMIQLEELGGKFSEFDEFIEIISAKREEIYNAFESKKVQLIEKRNKKSTSLKSSANRILKGITNRLKGMKSVNEINGYMVSDLMVDKVRDVIKELITLGDTVKADEIQSTVKRIKEDALRQLKDKNELFESENVITFGKHNFLVNKQNIDLTIVPKEDGQYYHITGTNFFEKINDQEFMATAPVWSQSVVSQSNQVYKSEYLAWLLFLKLKEQSPKDQHEIINFSEKELIDYVAAFMGNRYQESYSKGIHDKDAAIILKNVMEMHINAGVLKYNPITRSCSIFAWLFEINADDKSIIQKRINAVGILKQAFPNTNETAHLEEDLALLIQPFILKNKLEINSIICAKYLIEELDSKDHFSIGKEAFDLGDKFNKYLKDNKLTIQFEKSSNQIEDPYSKYKLIASWLTAFIETFENNLSQFVDETAAFYMLEKSRINLINFSLNTELEDLVGDHRLINKGKYALNYHSFSQKMENYCNTSVPLFKKYTSLKKNLISTFKEKLKLDELKPRVMSSFVRNKLINQVYLPLIGDNLAKQIGSAGENKRTDLMGMLLLISPPGYGKTTLMEYIASRLGVVFLKINGPALGHDVVSLDPDDAPNMSAREEVEKLNLGLEMGDNVMIYLDDIQHCNPEFLQKFISLCDAQRKIEGVYKGKSKTYDLRGKKVCVVMAGNPFTESGDKFQIPDMLSNRADIYNLGDIIGDQADVFEMSYIENSLTSNVILRNLVGKSQNDLYSLVKIAQSGSAEGIEFESNHTSEEIKDYVSVLEKMIVVRKIILDINQEYIKSAAMDDQYRIEPPFKLQGSYRNMNRITEKIIAIMNDDELKTLMLSYYENESQTLTTSAESNLLKFKGLTGWRKEEEENRWEDILTVYQKQQKMKGFGANQQMGALLEKVELLTQGIFGIKNELGKN
jgi:hypothetical protein|tara:strand:+ start:6016 stop:10896 length:4881 start_codon:yes stop_codon:yes gene_type:complete